MDAAFFPDNRIDLLETGSEYFPALIEAIEAAQAEVRIETYIFADDAIGRLVSAALARAARRGVAVHVLVDGFGSRGFMAALGRHLVADGVQVLIYGPDVSPLTLRRHRLRRLHRKLAMIDGRVGFVGGINLIDDIDSAALASPRYDYAVRIEGPLLKPIQKSMQHLWRLVRWARLRRRMRRSRYRYAAALPCGKTRAALLCRDNLRHRRDIEDAYLAAIGSAKNEIVLANAYFLPGRRFRHALMAAAQRGVKVVILLQGQVEYRLLHYATQALYGAFLLGGVHIHEYRKSFLHAKVAVIDGVWATVGSSNIDPFSLLLAREANVVVENAQFATKLRTSLMKAIQADAVEVLRDDWTKKPLFARVATWLAYSLVRLLVGLAGNGKENARSDANAERIVV